MQRSLTLLGAVLAIAARCGDRTSDSNSAPEVSVATVDLQLGTVQGGGPESFGRLGGLSTDAAGRIFVADSQAREIRVFDAEGAHLYSFGGRGSGPGEVLGPCCIAWSPDSLLWVRDGRDGLRTGLDVRLHHSRW